MKKETTTETTTTAIAQTVFKKTKPALTAKQQLQAVAMAMQQKAMNDSIEFNKKEQEQIKLVNDLATKEFQLHATKLKINDFYEWGTEEICAKIIFKSNAEIKAEFDKLQLMRKNKPRVYNITEYLSQLRNAQANKPENNTIAKLLESPEIVNKLAAFGKDLIEGVKNKQAITL